jgi:hypothetical protein
MERKKSEGRKTEALRKVSHFIDKAEGTLLRMVLIRNWVCQVRQEAFGPKYSRYWSEAMNQSLSKLLV